MINNRNLSLPPRFHLGYPVARRRLCHTAANAHCDNGETMAEIITIAESEQRLDHAVAAVVEAGRKASLRHWVPATSGNFSARIDENTIAITRSGTDKATLTRGDVLIVDLDAPDPRASAEAPLHYALYRDLPSVTAIFHIHSPSATMLSHGLVADSIRLSGWELLKALAGVRSHEAEIDVPVFSNDQDTVRLAALASQRFAGANGAQLSPGYVISGHGLYAWGTTPAEAWRHTEALETLLTYQLNRKG
jgi:methylthioribulose-1-phosphate dehydratase